MCCGYQIIDFTYELNPRQSQSDPWLIHQLLCLTFLTTVHWMIIKMVAKTDSFINSNMGHWSMVQGMHANYFICKGGVFSFKLYILSLILYMSHRNAPVGTKCNFFLKTLQLKVHPIQWLVTNLNVQIHLLKTSHADDLYFKFWMSLRFLSSSRLVFVYKKNLRNNKKCSWQSLSSMMINLNHTSSKVDNCSCN